MNEFSRLVYIHLNVQMINVLTIARLALNYNNKYYKDI